MADERDKRPPPEEIDPDAPPTAEEVAASQRLRDALEGGAAGSLTGLTGEEARDLELVASLRAAWDPSSIDEGAHEAIVDATPDAQELAAAASLRDALADALAGRSTRPPEGDALLAMALRSAFAPREIDPDEHRAIVDAALAKMPAKLGGEVVTLASRRRTVVRVTFGVVTGAVALAASVFLVVTSAPRAVEAPLARARTTQPLFTEPFKPGESSARIDRIASARAADFRDNRFAKWGVR